MSTWHLSKGRECDLHTSELGDIHDCLHDTETKINMQSPRMSTNAPYTQMFIEYNKIAKISCFLLSKPEALSLS